MTNIFFLLLWAAGGLGIGLLLGWWQSRSIEKFEQTSAEKMMAKVYLQSLPRVLLVAALLFVALLQNLWYGIVFVAVFTISRWIWTWSTLRKLKAKDT